MKITVRQLRKVIKEEVSRVLTEADKPQFSGVAGDWLGLMKKNSTDPGMLQDLAGAWDAMVAAGTVDPKDIKSVSARIGDEFGLSPQAISFHLRKNPSATGAAGQGLLDAAQAHATEQEAGKAASAAKSAVESEALAAAQTQLGIDFPGMYLAAQHADDPGAYRKDMKDYEDLKNKVIQAWDPATKKFDKQKL
jgi:hypothetical protein